MARTESTFSQRIGARISPELKGQLQALTESGQFDSEADIVREALWAYVEQVESGLAPAQEPAPTPGDSSSPEWAMHVLLILTAMIGSRILNSLRPEQIKPAALMDEAIQETIFNQRILREKLAVARRLAQAVKEDENKASS